MCGIGNSISIEEVVKLPNVYCMNSWGNNIKRAGRFGQVIEISEEPLNSFSIDRLTWTLAPGLENFQPDDYLLLTGPGSAYIVAGVLLFSRPEITELKCLRFDGQRQQYVPLIVPKLQLESEPTIKPPGRIYVLNYSGHIITSAFEHSDLPKEDKLVILSKGNVNQYGVDQLVQQICYGTEPNAVGLNQFQKGDMLLISGPGVAHIIAASAFVAMGKDISLLLFAPRGQNYLRRDIALSDMLETARIATGV